MHARLVLPVKSFTSAKNRLSPVLGERDRRNLASRLAVGIVQENLRLAPLVVSDNSELEKWAKNIGAQFLLQQSPGLNGAVEDARAYLSHVNVDRMIIAHADLASVPSLAWTADEFDGITIVPDRHGDGTNVLVVPSTIPFRFQYGRHSFRAHWDEAITTGQPVRVLHDRHACIDLDVPADMRLAAARYFA